MNQETKFAIRSKFKRMIDIDDYRKLTHFAVVKKVLAPMPGTWQMYIFHNNSILCACNATCLNEWLYLHGQAKRRKLTQKAVDIKLKYNNFDTAIDNRTDEWTLHPIRKPYAKRTKLNQGREMTRMIWTTMMDSQPQKLPYN